MLKQVKKKDFFEQIDYLQRSSLLFSNKDLKEIGLSIEEDWYNWEVDKTLELYHRCLQRQAVQEGFIGFKEN